MLPDSIAFEHFTEVDESAYRQYSRISGTGMSIPRIIRLTNFKNGQCGFSINEHFPLDIVSKTTMNPSTQNSILQETGLSDTYFREYSDNDGNNTAIKIEGYAELMPFWPMEIKKNVAFLNAIASNDFQCAGRIYPLWYLDPEQRVGNVDKKYQKRYNENKERYPNMVSIIIPLNKVN